MPPCPGIESPKSFTPNARLKPLAKNPPKGAMRDAKRDTATAWSWMGTMVALRVGGEGGGGGKVVGEQNMIWVRMA